jgi:acyl-CoA synthetase (AMP-forming)/AMP-acid ligase II
MTSPLLSIVHGPPLSAEPGIGPLTIPGFFRDVTTRFANHEALVYRMGEAAARWSYKELWDRAFEVARALIACGVNKDSRVGVLMTNRPEFLAATFGAALAGGVAVPLNTFSTAPELAQLLQASGVSVLLFERHIAGKDFAAVMGELEPALKATARGELQSAAFPFLRRVVAVDALGDDLGAIETWDAFLKHAAHTPPDLVDARAAMTKPSDVGAIFFSSGTTSLPKGIVHAHRAISVQWQRAPNLFQTEGDVRFWTANGFFWSGNFTLAIGNAFASGGSIVLQSVFDPEQALALMEKERVTYPVASMHQWSRLEGAPNWTTTDLSSLRYVDYRYPNREGTNIKTDWRLPLAYGATETLAINCATRGLKLPLPNDCYGVPLAGNTLKVVDPVTGHIVPRGERGELALKGVTLMMGYLGKPAEECFDEEGYYRTGDGGHVDEEGRVFFEGRLSDIIKTGGANVSPLEIDAAIRSHPDIKVTQTIGLPHPTLGEIVVACVVPHEGAALDEAGLRDYLKARLASFKVPRRFLFLKDEDIAMTGSNKVKAGALRELAAKRLGPEG